MPNAAATSRVAHIGSKITSSAMKPSWVSTPQGGVCLTPITSETTYSRPMATLGSVGAGAIGVTPGGGSLW